MAITSSQSCKRCESETVPKRPVMPRDIFDAATKGDSDVLIECLGLQTKEQKDIQEDGDSNHESTKDLPFGSELVPLTQRTSPFATKSKTTKLSDLSSKVQPVLETLFSTYLLQRCTISFALMVFERDPSLLKMQNKMLETPLHCAAKVGNQEVILKFIDIKPADVKDVLQETNEKGDTALHVAVRYNCADICRNLMEFDSELAYKVNKEMFSPFHIAIDEEYDSVAEQMLCVDPVLAFTQLTDGMFPVHLATRKNNQSMVLSFMKNFPDYAELVDSRGRNLFHIVAEEADNDDFFRVLSSRYEDMTTRMNDATDYEGNTPLHIAAMKGHRDTMECILYYFNMKNCVAEFVKNKQGLTPYEVSKKQLVQTCNEYLTGIKARICAYEWTYGEKFSEEWFMDVMLSQFLHNRWERTQIIGLGSVLITTVTFAAGFTISGGYNQDHGTPVIGGRYMFWAFILANTLAFIQGFLSLFALLINALPGIPMTTFLFATIIFLFAANIMAVAFGLGLYVILAPVCLPIAITLLVITLFIGSPILLSALLLPGERNFTLFTIFLYRKNSILAIYAVSILFIFCLTLLSP